MTISAANNQHEHAFEGKEGAIKARLDGRRSWDGECGNQFDDGCRTRMERPTLPGVLVSPIFIFCLRALPTETGSRRLDKG